MSLAPSPEMYFTRWPLVPHRSLYTYGRMHEVEDGLRQPAPKNIGLVLRRAGLWGSDMHDTRISTD